MAKEYINRKKLEKHGFIHVNKYYNNLYEASDKKDLKCDNCSWLYNHRRIYDTQDNNRIGICFACSKKVHNSSSGNPKFNKVLSGEIS